MSKIFYVHTDNIHQLPNDAVWTQSMAKNLKKKQSIQYFTTKIKEKQNKTKQKNVISLPKLF